jgi:hypothetical protein
VLTLEVSKLEPVDPATEGRYEAWVVDQSGVPRSAGRIISTTSGAQTLTLTSPVSNPSEVYITLEGPDDEDGSPDQAQILGGRFQGAQAELSYMSRLTPGVPFVEAPGTHVLFTPSDNNEVGYPSNEDSGMWLFSFGDEPDDDGAFWLDFTPADFGWIYEGWLVLDYGMATEVWFSYGKFQADSDKKASSKDDTGVGPFSGQLDYVNALPEEIVMPGDDWVSNPHGYPLPGGLPESILPLDLNGCRDVLDGDGNVLLACRDFWRGPSRFTHVITMEPIRDLGEEPWLAEPFYLEVYSNPIGEGDPATKRTLVYHPENLPVGTARITVGG